MIPAASNNLLLMFIDTGILVLSLLSLYYLRQMAVGLKISRSLGLIGLGMIALALDHFASVFWIHPMFGNSLLFGANAGMMIHHFSNLFGYSLILLGYVLAGRIVLERIAVLLSTIIALTVMAYLLVSLLPVLFPTLKLDEIGLILITSCIVALSLVFQPIRSWLAMWLDQLFFHYSYDSAKLLQAISRICSSTVTLAPLLNKSLITLGETMHLGQVEFVLIEQGQVYARQAYRDMSFRLRIDEFLQIQTMQVSIIVPVDTSAEVKEMLTKAEIGAVVPVIVENSFIGILLVGVKDTGELLNQQDLDTLKIIVPEIAIAMNHAKAVEKIQRFNETLQEGINKATGELRASNVHLQELDRAKDEFISLASHQLSTPLTTVKGYLSMMLDGEAGALTPPQQKFAQRSMDGSERMAHLITDLLNASRMNAGKFKIIRAMTDLGQVVDEEVGQLYQHAKDKGLQLIWNKPATPVMLPFDANKTRQVIMNFIDNAIFYTAAGSITVALDYPSAEHVRVTVKDTGIGVPEAAKSEMFSKFFRAPNAQIARPDGTGLGLYLAKRVVEDQGGTIIFESTEGQGSNFGFTLPLHPAEEPALFTV